jgi:hypothetical protein
MSRSSAKATKPVGVSASPVTVYMALFFSSSYAFRTQEWFNRARDALRFVQDFVLSYLVGWYTPHFNSEDGVSIFVRNVHIQPEDWTKTAIQMSAAVRTSNLI